METNKGKGYILSCCSTADLTQQHFENRKIHYLCYHYYLDGREYCDDLGKSFSLNEFYQAMANGAETKTAQPGVGDFYSYFEPFLKQGLDIIHICLSSGLTGVLSAANIAKSDLLEIYPDRKIYLIDSLGASSGYGLLMDKLADLRDYGMGIDELYDWANNHKLELQHWFFSTDLTFYIKGGRVSKASGWVGTVLNICPLLNVDSLGRLIPRYKIRGKKNVIEKTVSQMEKYADGGPNYNGKCYISHSYCYDDARAVADLVERRFPNLSGRVEINKIGTTIGCHTGPGTVALFFWGDRRND